MRMCCSIQIILIFEIIIIYCIFLTCSWDQMYDEELKTFHEIGDAGEIWYSRTPLIRPPSESHWCSRIRGMVAREGFVYEQKPLSVCHTKCGCMRGMVVGEGGRSSGVLL